MAFVIADRIMETTATAGTGPLALGGAVTTDGGFVTFGSKMSVADTCEYCIKDSSTTAWEVGLGTYSATNTLTRTTVYASSNANAAVVLAGNATTVVFITLPASRAAGFAPKASPTFTGTVTVPAPATGDSTASASTTAFVGNATQGSAAIVTTGGITTLTAAQSSVPIQIVTGTLTSAATLIVPNSGIFAVSNKTTGAFTLTVKTLAGTGYVVPPGASSSLIADGTNVVVGRAIPIGPCKFGSIQTRMPFWGDNSNASAGFTLSTVYTAETDFDWCRFVYTNMATANFTVTAAAVAASSKLNDTTNPMNASSVADNTLWVPVTFNGAGAPQDIPPTAGSVRTCVVPASVQGLQTTNGSDYVPGIVYSDWMRVQSQPRLDGGASLPLVFTRTYAVGVQSCAIGNFAPLSTAPVGGGAWDSVAFGRIVRTNATSGDFATTPGTLAANANGYLTPTAVQFMSRRRGLTVVAVGDSLVAGTGTTTTMNGPFHIACAAVSTASVPVIYTNLGFQGQPSPTFFTIAYKYVVGMRPDVLAIKCESPNDTSAGAASVYQISLANAFALADWCTRQNIVPILMTAEPWGYSGTNETNRLALNTAIRASGWLYVDFDAVLTNGASPAVIQTQYQSTVNPPHYNDAGSTAVSAVITPILQKILLSKP